ncbi:MAG: GDSL-type esterase/lipase family protein [Planctomycetota bacterium]
MTKPNESAAGVPEPVPVRVACVGASVTFGRGLPNRRQDCYPAGLQRLLEAAGHAVRVRNFGYSGATASRSGNEPYWETPSFLSATRFEPHVTVIMLGTNDAQFANAAARSTTGRDLADLVEHFRGLVEPPADVLLTQCPPAFPPVPEIDFDALQSVVRPAIAAAAEAIDAPLVDLLTPLADRGDAFPDGLHPTAEIARRIAEIMAETLAPVLTGLRNVTLS